MEKCFFYLKDGADGVVGSLGLQYFDAKAATLYAFGVAEVLRTNPGAQSYSIVATDQAGHEIARVSLDHKSSRLSSKKRRLR